MTASQLGIIPGLALLASLALCIQPQPAPRAPWRLIMDTIIIDDQPIANFEPGDKLGPISFSLPEALHNQQLAQVENHGITDRVHRRFADVRAEVASDARIFGITEAEARTRLARVGRKLPSTVGLGIYDPSGELIGYAAITRRRRHGAYEVALADTPQPVPQSMQRRGAAAAVVAYTRVMEGLEASWPGHSLRQVPAA